MTTPTAPAPTATTVPALPAGTVAAFVTLGGALTALTRDPARTDTPYDHSWRCLGCGDTSRTPDSARAAREEANSHASQCRSIALPVPVA